MTRYEIIKMAREAGGVTGGHDTMLPDLARIERFAALVAEAATEEANARANKSWALMCEKMVAAEREACAKVAKAISDKYAFGYYGNEVDTADEIESAIRARGAA